DQLGGEVDEVGCVEPKLAADACRELSEVAGGRHGPDATGFRSQGRTPPKIRRRWAARRLRLVIRCAALPDPKTGESSRTLARLAAGSMVGTAGWSYASDAPTLALSHAWIVVPPGALERAALERAGFRIAPTVNRHDGQGTASITVELLNGFLEL